MDPANISRIYYFSGTGNTKWLAETLAAELSAQGRTAEALPLEGTFLKETLADGRHWPEGLNGLCYPTYCFNAPWSILRLLRRMPSGNGREIFLASSRSAMLWGNRTLCGISGLSLWLPWLWLRLKGYKPRGLYAAELPCNWVAVRPGCKQECAEIFFKHEAPKLASYAEALSQRRSFFPIKLFAGIIFDLLALPLAILSPYAVFALGKLFMASDNCNGCGRCAATCPQKGIRMRRNRPYWTWRCLSCMRCLNICPQKAVYVMHPVAAAVLLTGLAWGGPFWIWLLFSPLALTLLYPIIFELTARSKLGRLLPKASLTTYWRHYQAPGANSKIQKNTSETKPQ